MSDHIEYKQLKKIGVNYEKMFNSCINYNLKF